MRGLRTTACTAIALFALPAAAAVAATTAAQPTWHSSQAHVPEAREAGRSGSGVVVGVLDTWVDAAHPDFEGRVLAGADCLSGTCEDGPAAKDRCDHGTHVAGTVAATSFGVATRATILPVRVLGYDPASGECTGRPEAVSAGIRWAVGHGAQVLNLSLGPDVPGLSASSSIPAAVQEAAAAGVLVVFSAGNSSVPVTDSYGDDALIVAATGPDGELAGYSQRGVGVDLAAPGGDPAMADVCTEEDCITSLFPGGRYAVAAGTSMAAPVVSGVAALLLGQLPSRTLTQLRERLLTTARPLADAGRGLVDARRALGATTRATRPRASAQPRPVQLSPAPSPRPAAGTARPAAPSRSRTRPPVRPLVPAPPVRPTASAPRPSTAPSPTRPPAQATPGPVAVADPGWVAALATALVGLAALGNVALRRR